MMLSARRQFLDAFLGALGAAEIVDYSETATEARGTARFASDSEQIDLTGADEDDFQDFCWHVPEEQAPAPLVYRIANVICRYHLLSIDKLRVSRDTLFAIFIEDSEMPVARAEFDAALESLESIEVAMVNDGIEEDCYFIHE